MFLLFDKALDLGRNIAPKKPSRTQKKTWRPRQGLFSKYGHRGAAKVWRNVSAQIQCLIE
jgi:hypothetical protein